MESTSSCHEQCNGLKFQGCGTLGDEKAISVSQRTYQLYPQI